ncbi:MAG: DUF938 domain-containing protein [Cyanobium sp. D14.bin.5]|nr:DUF938 domain-containing protein [Cyanobium sp. D14.bin.5]
MLFSPACERNKGPILAVLKEWLPARAQVLEIGSGSGQHAAFFCQQIGGIAWQTSERQESLTDLQAQLEALSPTLPAAIALDVSIAQQWPRQSFDAVFSANTAHIMSAAAVTHLLAGASQVLRPSGLLLLYGPFHDGGIHTAASNAAFDEHLRSLDPAMGVRDAIELVQQAQNLGLELLADLPLPANNRMLVLERPKPASCSQ